MNKFIEVETNKNAVKEAINTIKSLAQGQWLSIYGQLAPASFSEAISKKNKHVACPVHGGKDGFRFFDDVEETGGAVCNTCGEFTDGIAFLQWANDWKLWDTLKQIDTSLGTNALSQTNQLPKERGGKSQSTAQKAPEPIKVQPTKRNDQLIQRLVKDAKCKPSETVKAYLTNRGLGEVIDKLPGCLKSHDALGYYANNKKLLDSPALIGEVTKNGKRVGLQRQYLTNEGLKLPLYDDVEEKALPSKTMIGAFKGAMSGGAVQFEQPKKVLHVGEGIETMLAVWHSVGEPTWACCTAPLLRALIVPDHVERVIIWEDKDRNSAGHKAAFALGDKLRKQDIEVFYATPTIDIPPLQDGVDWLDEYNQGGKEAIQQALTDVLDPSNAIADIDLYPDEAIKRAVKELNKTYVHVVHKGKNYIARETTDEIDKKSFEMFKLQEFENLPMLKRKVLVGHKGNGEPKYKKASKVWLESEEALCSPYGMTFKPVPERWVNGKLNMYFGLGVEPLPCDEEDIKPYLDMVKELICSSNEDYYNYLMNWLAHMIQKPEEKPEVAIILKSGQGTGKGSMVEPIEEMIKHHYFMADNPDQIAGRFNAALENQIFIFADEAFFASKAATDRLKTLITSKTQTIERKTVDAVMTRSYCRIIMATNRDNIISAEEDERRYFILQVSEKLKQKHSFWKPYHDWAKKVPLAGMLLYYLQNRDISDYNPRIAPCTDALVEQKIHGLEPPMRFIFDALNNGGFVLNSPWPARMPVPEMTRHFEEYLEKKNLKLHGDASKILGKKLSKLGFKRKQVFQQPYAYQIPSLDEARKRFEENVKGSIEWDT